jgi:hypothetical protein
MRKIEATLKLFDSPEEPLQTARTDDNSQQTERSTEQQIPANQAAPADQKASLSGL